LSPLVWAGAAAWAASAAGTELSLHSWRTTSAAASIIGLLVAAVLGATAIVRRRTAFGMAAAVAAAALGIALLHGSWLGYTASALEDRGLADRRGTVVADPVTGQFGVSVRVRLDDAPWGLVALVNWPKGEAPPAYGRRVVLSTRLRSATRGVPSSDDSFRRGTLVRASPWRVAVVGWAAPPLGLVAAWRSDALNRVKSLDSPGCEALASMLFAVAPAGAGATAMQDARTAGVAWAITASGLHLAAIVLLADRLASFLGLGTRGRVWSVVLALVAVTVAAGLKLSLIRAALAAGATLLTRMWGRRRDGTAVLGAIVTVMLLLDPSAAYDVGLALGTLALGSMAVFGGLAATWLRPVLGRNLSRAIGAAVTAQVAVAPLTAGLFGGVALFGPLVLATSAPFVQAAVTLGIAGAVTAPLLRRPGEALLWLGSAFAEAASRVWALAAAVPNASMSTPAVPPWVGFVWAAAAAALWLRWPRPRRSARIRIAVIATAAVISLTAFMRPTMSTGVLVLDVGQGDAILVRDGGHSLLVDTGPDPVVLRQALARAGGAALDGVVLTHAHADHVGGLDGLPRASRPGWIGVPDVVDADVDALARKCGPLADAVIRLRRDMTFTVGETSVRVLWPQGGERELAANDTSVILLLERGGRQALLLGDAEERAQRGALDAWAQPVEMLKVAHHGSPNGNVPEALALWRPKVALISVGVGNTFGHPSAAALQSLAQVGAVVRRTDREGDLAWDSGGPTPAAADQDRFALAACLVPSGRWMLCDNLYSGWLPGCPRADDFRKDAWLPPTSRTSSRSTSSTALRSCCSSAPRSVCAIGSPRSQTSTSTWRRSTGIPPPRQTS
jgi:competence protein ComEC